MALFRLWVSKLRCSWGMVVSPEIIVIRSKELESRDTLNIGGKDNKRSYTGCCWTSFQCLEFIRLHLQRIVDAKLLY